MTRLASDALRKEVDAVFTAIEQAWQVHLCCHVFGSMLEDDQGTSIIPPRWMYHRSQLCMRVKQRANHACIAHDLYELPRLVGDSEACSERQCPAGIIELIQPVRRDGRLEALLYLGQFPASGTGTIALTAAKRTQLRAAAALLAGWLAALIERLAAGRTNGADDRLTRIIAFIDHRLAADPTLSEVARSLRLSSERARHLISETAGCSFRALKDQRRLLVARELLTHGFKPIGEIDYACGCADPGWFARWFGRRTGESPSGFRSRLRGSTAQP